MLRTEGFERYSIASRKQVFEGRDVGWRDGVTFRRELVALLIPEAEVPDPWRRDFKLLNPTGEDVCSI